MADSNGCHEHTPINLFLFLIHAYYIVAALWCIPVIYISQLMETSRHSYGKSSHHCSVTFGDKKIKLKPEQISTTILGRIFNLIPETLFLLSTEGDVSTADNSGQFLINNSLELESMALIKAPKYKEGHKYHTSHHQTKYMYQYSHGNHPACCSSCLGKGNQGKIWKSKRVPPRILKEKPLQKKLNGQSRLTFVNTV